MFRRLFHRERSSVEDLVSQWPEVSQATPLIDLAKRTIGPLRFGCSLEEAAILGRPTRVNCRADEYCELVYASAGVQLDFDRRRLAYAAFFVGRDDTVPNGDVTYCSPRFSDGARFSSASDVSEIEAAFGTPKSRETDAEERVWTYEIGELTIEFEFDAAGRLKRLAVFPSHA